MSDRLNTLADMLVWTGNNTAHNLEYIPEDRLSWKPEPTAKSALEIIQHASWALTSLGGILTHRAAAPVEVPMPASRKEAQRQLLDATEACAAVLRRLPPAELDTLVKGGRAEFSLGRWATIPVTDLTHHHGQIAYIQTLLGDTEDHIQDLRAE